MLLKLFGLGMKKYLSDNFNIFDAVIVGVSVFELFSSAESSGLSVLRAFRLVRVFKIIRSWVSLRKLLETVMNSMSAIGNLGVLTILFMFISALLAKQFFFQPLEEDDGSESRYSFSSTIQSLITIFIVITGENWNAIMVQVIDANGSIAGPTIFFVAEMIIGNYMLLNLFLAILLKFISEGDEEEPKEDKSKSQKNLPPGSIDANGETINVNENEKSVNIGKANEIADSGQLNSSNSNIEEEFEQIKLQLQQLSNMNMQQVQIAQTRDQKGNHSEQFDHEGGDEFDDIQEIQSNNRSKNKKKQV